MPYAAGDLYCTRQRCRRLHAERQRIREVDDPSGDPCPVHVDADSSGESIEDQIERGVCPWCSDYEGDHVGQHASSAHPEDWQAYTTE